MGAAKMADSFLPASALLGLVDYSQSGAVLSDYYSPAALSAFDSDQIEVADLYFKGNASASDRPALRPFLRLALRGGRGYETVGLSRREDWPGAMRELGETDRYRVEQDLYFLSDKALRVEYRLLPKACGDDSRAPEAIVFGGIHQAYAEARAAILPCGAGESIELDFTRRYLMYVTKRETGYRVRIRIAGRGGFARTCLREGDAVPTLPTALADGPGASIATSPSIAMETSLTTSDRLRYEGALAFSRGDDGAWLAAVDVAFEWEGAEPALDLRHWSLKMAVARWEELFLGIPPPPVDDWYSRRKLAGALYTIAGAAVRSEGYGNFSKSPGLLAAALGWASTDFFWDHMISAAALGALDPDIQAEAAIHFLKHCSGGRLAPGILMAFPLYGEAEAPPDGCYAPIASWAVAKALLCGHHKPDVGRLYPYLKALNRGWFATMDRDGDGIPEWMNSGHPADNSPLYDRYSPKPGATNFPLPPFVSVNLCSYLYLDCRILASFARDQGIAEDEALFEAEALRLERTLLDKCWNAEDLVFYDLDPEGRQVRVKTFFGLLPLWAGVSLEAAIARAAIQRHLLNPAEFWGEVPFPSVAYDEPSYDAEGYWRGRTWPHVYFWNTELLVRHGYHKQAALACERYLRLMRGSRNHVENMPSDFRLSHRAGVPHYNWGAAVDYFMLQGWELRPVLA
jgi:hypothetical protein